MRWRRRGRGERNVRVCTRSNFLSAFRPPSWSRTLGMGLIDRVQKLLSPGGRICGGADASSARGPQPLWANGSGALLPGRGVRGSTVHIASDHSRLRLRRDGQATGVDRSQDGVAAPAEEGAAGVVAELFGIVSVAGVAEEFGAVGVGDDGFEMQFPVVRILSNLGEGTDGDLAAAPETVQQSAFAGG